MQIAFSDFPDTSTLKFSCQCQLSETSKLAAESSIGWRTDSYSLIVLRLGVCYQQVNVSVFQSTYHSTFPSSPAHFVSIAQPYWPFGSHIKYPTSYIRWPTCAPWDESPVFLGRILREGARSWSTMEATKATTGCVQSRILDRCGSPCHICLYITNYYIWLKSNTRFESAKQSVLSSLPESSTTQARERALSEFYKKWVTQESTRLEAYTSEWRTRNFEAIIFAAKVEWRNLQTRLKKLLTFGGGRWLNTVC